VAGFAFWKPGVGDFIFPKSAAAGPAAAVTSAAMIRIDFMTILQIA
jgi:hypothetical protein